MSKNDFKVLDFVLLDEYPDWNWSLQVLQL